MLSRRPLYVTGLFCSSLWLCLVWGRNRPSVDQNHWSRSQRPTVWLLWSNKCKKRRTSLTSSEPLWVRLLAQQTSRPPTSYRYQTRHPRPASMSLARLLTHEVLWRVLHETRLPPWTCSVCISADFLRPPLSSTTTWRRTTGEHHPAPTNTTQHLPTPPSTYPHHPVCCGDGEQLLSWNNNTPLWIFTVYKHWQTLPVCSGVTVKCARPVTCYSLAGASCG